MPVVDRRTMLRALAIGGVAAALTAPRAGADVFRLPRAKVPIPTGVLTRLPGDGNQLALTVDDGASTQVVAAFIDFCRNTGSRLTFFVNGANSSWTVNAPALGPMVESGQIQLGNHTWSHPNLTKISLTDVGDQIRRNATFLQNSYGVDGSPYFRPPYGAHNLDVDRVAADLGYPTVTLWSGTIGDSRVINEQQMLGYAQQSFEPQQIILAHANLPTITRCFPQLDDIITSRGLQTVTLADVFA